MRIASLKLARHPVASSSILLNLIRDSVYGFVTQGLQTQPYELKQAIDTLNNMINNHNLGMDALANTDKLNREDFIDYAHMKENTK